MGPRAVASPTASKATSTANLPFEIQLFIYLTISQKQKKKKILIFNILHQSPKPTDPPWLHPSLCMAPQFLHLATTSPVTSLLINLSQSLLQASRASRISHLPPRVPQIYSLRSSPIPELRWVEPVGGLGWVETGWGWGRPSLDFPIPPPHSPHPGQGLEGEGVVKPHLQLRLSPPRGRASLPQPGPCGRSRVRKGKKPQGQRPARSSRSRPTSQMPPPRPSHPAQGFCRCCYCCCRRPGAANTATTATTATATATARPGAHLRHCAPPPARDT